MSNSDEFYKISVVRTSVLHGEIRRCCVNVAKILYAPSYDEIGDGAQRKKENISNYLSIFLSDSTCNLLVTGMMTSFSS